MEERELSGALDDRARAWVQGILVFRSVSSTNDVLKEAARQGAPEGTVAISERQAAGRGRHGRTWESPSGNLFLSFLLRPPPTVALSLIPLAAGLATAEAVEAEGPSCRLKWPNDVLAGERKLAGILAEASADTTGVFSVVVGIGANVNLDLDQLPEDVRRTATSLFAETGHRRAATAVAAAVLGRWAVWYDALRTDGARVCAAWRARSVDWWGRSVEVISAGERVVGIARDIDESGALLLETDDGRRLTVLSGDARALRPAD